MIVDNLYEQRLQGFYSIRLIYTKKVKMCFRKKLVFVSKIERIRFLRQSRGEQPGVARVTQNGSEKISSDSLNI